MPRQAAKFGVVCPVCGRTDSSSVKDSRVYPTADFGNCIKRTRQCTCGRRWQTVEIPTALLNPNAAREVRDSIRDAQHALASALAVLQK